MKLRIEIRRQLCERIKPAVSASKSQQGVVEDGKQSAFQQREHTELVFRPFDGAKSGAQSSNLFALVERFGADEHVSDTAPFERANVILSKIDAAVRKSPE